MALSQDCKDCLFRRQKDRVKNIEVSVRDTYLDEVAACIAASGEADTAPVIVALINDIHERYFHTRYSFEDLKVKYNQVMLQREAEIRAEIAAADDPLKLGLLYARAGNYIDFGALGSVDDAKLDSILNRCREEVLDARTYGFFKETCKKAKQLVYLTDNCGEIVLDKLLIEQLQKQFPQCGITVIVRGGDVLNDATCTDAAVVGLDKLVSVIGNGNGIAGTSLPHISQEARALLDTADCIIAKGQANFETLNRCGLPIFYLFLCKCNWFVKNFGLPQFEGVFIRDCDLA